MLLRSLHLKEEKSLENETPVHLVMTSLEHMSRSLTVSFCRNRQKVQKRRLLTAGGFDRPPHRGDKPPRTADTAPCWTHALAEEKEEETTLYFPMRNEPSTQQSATMQEGKHAHARSHPPPHTPL